MSYQISLASNIESSVDDNTFQTLLVYSLTGIAVDTTSLLSVKIIANTEQIIDIPLADKLIVLGVSSDKLVDVSLKTDALDSPIYSSCPNTFFLKVAQDGVIFDRLTIKALADDAIVRVAYAINYLAA